MILIDPGHGGNDPGATFRKWKEKDINLTVALLLCDMDPIRYRLSRETDVALTLQNRVNQAKLASAMISLHCNMTLRKDGSASGFETWIYKGGRAKDLAARIEVPGLRNRGVKNGEFYVLRFSRPPAVLVEMGFLDSELDRVVLLEKPALIASALHSAVKSWEAESRAFS